MADMAVLFCSVDVIPYSEVKRIDEKLQQVAPHPGVFDYRVRLKAESKSIIPGQTSAEQEPMTTLVTKQAGQHVNFPISFLFVSLSILTQYLSHPDSS